MNEILVKWCQEMFVSRKAPLEGRTAYGMKHIFQDDTEIYATEAEFTQAMIHCGHEPVRNNEGVCNFRISKKSKAFEWRARRLFTRGWYLCPESVESFYEECGKRK
jgi:hypothetical protein